MSDDSLCDLSQPLQATKFLLDSGLQFPVMPRAVPSADRFPAAAKALLHFVSLRGCETHADALIRKKLSMKRSMPSDKPDMI